MAKSSSQSLSLPGAQPLMRPLHYTIALFHAKLMMLSIQICYYLLKVVWFAAWLGVVLLGIDIGLGVGVVMALVVVIWKSSRSEKKVTAFIYTRKKND